MQERPMKLKKPEDVIRSKYEDNMSLYSPRNQHDNFAFSMLEVETNSEAQVPYSGTNPKHFDSESTPTQTEHSSHAQMAKRKSPMKSVHTLSEVLKKKERPPNINTRQTQSVYI